MKLAAMALGLACVLGACASDAGLREAGKLALYRANAGPPVDSFQYFGRINGWTPLGDSAIAIWTSPSRAYLLDLYGPCGNIEFAQAISLTNRTGRVYAKFDKVLVHNTGAIQIPCTIQQIRPLDTKAIRQAEKARREQPAASSES